MRAHMFTKLLHSEDKGRVGHEMELGLELIQTQHGLSDCNSLLASHTTFKCLVLTHDVHQYSHSALQCMKPWIQPPALGGGRNLKQAWNISAQ